jgi:hypothetical protein
VEERTTGPNSTTAGSVPDLCRFSLAISFASSFFFLAVVSPFFGPDALVRLSSYRLARLRPLPIPASFLSAAVPSSARQSRFSETPMACLSAVRTSGTCFSWPQRPFTTALPFPAVALLLNSLLLRLPCISLSACLPGSFLIPVPFLTYHSPAALSHSLADHQ